MNEEFTGLITNLQMEDSSLQNENSNLENEIWQLKLLVLPESLEDHLIQLQKKTTQTDEEMNCFKMEKKLLNICRDMNSACQIHSLYKKMAKDMGKELERRTFYY